MATPITHRTDGLAPSAALAGPTGSALRRTGLGVVGDAPWGTHFCAFYAGRENLLEILVPYFQAGLESGEFCMWVTAPPLGPDAAWAALAEAVPELEDHRRRGRIEILPHTEWYLRGGGFDRQRVLDGWVAKLEDALARGCAGLRLTGDTFWLEKADWKSFAEYESAVDEVLGQYRVLALCTYASDRCGVSEVADVIRNHQFALVKRDGRWDRLESFDRSRMQRSLRESETRYSLLFQNMQDGFAYCRMLYDAEGRPDDFVYLDVNGAFGRLTGLGDVVGRRVNEVIPGVKQAHPELFETYARVARSRRPERFEIDFRPLGKWLSISVYSPEPDHFVAVFDDITSRKRAEEKVRAANAQLTEAARRKDEFLSMLSHELRNPLAPIRNSILVLEHADADGEQARHAKEVIRRQSEHLARLVDDLLDVTRIARGKIELKRAPLDLTALVRRCGDDHAALMRERGLLLAVELPREPLWTDGDATRLAQVVGNLLHNAAKFTARGGRVHLGLEVARGAAEIHVRDTGVGIEPELLAQVFEPFVQGERTLARTDGGLGLGLALVKAVTELHGGSVRAASAGAGKGAELVVRLPIVAAEAAALTPIPRIARAETSRRVLIIDDNRDAAESLAEIVQMFGHVAEIAYDGPTGVARAKEKHPDVVLCDIGLPGMNGYEVVRTLRGDSALRAARMFAVSGHAQPEDCRKALEAGFDRHIAKPLDLDEIERILSGPTT